MFKLSYLKLFYSIFLQVFKVDIENEHLIKMDENFHEVKRCESVEKSEQDFPPQVNDGEFYMATENLSCKLLIFFFLTSMDLFIFANFIT